MSGYTPGPWTQGSRLRTECVWLDGHREPQVGMGDESTWIDCNTPANARLVAAAPKLLQELRGASTQMEMAAECIEAGRYDEALLHVRSMSRSRRTAIAAATGEQV